jgi:hypothetical protein
MNYVPFQNKIAIISSTIILKSQIPDKKVLSIKLLCSIFTHEGYQRPKLPELTIMDFICFGVMAPYQSGL